MEFEWDLEKEKVNLKKHGISFSYASLIFNGIVLTKHDDRFFDEHREISLGDVDGVSVLVVVHVDRNDKIRIISARKATQNERRIYYDFIKKCN